MAEKGSGLVKAIVKKNKEERPILPYLQVFYKTIAIKQHSIVKQTIRTNQESTVRPRIFEMFTTEVAL